MDESMTPWAVSFAAMSEDSLLRCSSVRSLKVVPLDTPASFRSCATPSTLPLTPRM